MKTKFASSLLALLLLAAIRGEAASLGEAMSDSIEAEKKLDYAAAIEPLEKVGPDATTSYFAQLRLGWLKYCNKDYAGSIACYQRASQLSPQSVEALLGLMLPQMASGKNDDALRTAQNALREDPNNYTAISRMAWILYSRRDYAAAISAYRKLVNHYPTDTEMQLGLGYALKLSGHTSEAAKCFQTVLLLSPGNTRAQEGLRNEQAAAEGPRGPMRAMMMTDGERRQPPR